MEMKRPNANIFRKKHCIHNINKTLKQEKEAIRETNKEIRRYFKIRGEVVVNTRNIPNVDGFISYYEERGFTVEHVYSDGYVKCGGMLSGNYSLAYDQYKIS
jgi:hypothetical protein